MHVGAIQLSPIQTIASIWISWQPLWCEIGGWGASTTSDHIRLCFPHIYKQTRILTQITLRVTLNLHIIH